MKAVILCAGYGTRCYPLTKNRAKSLLPIRGRPIVEFIVRKIQLVSEVNEIYIVTNHRFYNDFKEWWESFPATTPIKIIDDGSTNLKDKLGAIKDLIYVIEKESIQEDLLVVGGDNLFSFTINGFISFANSLRPKSLIGVYNLNGKTKANKFGVVKLDERKRVVEFHEKPAKLNGPSLVSICLYFFPKEKLHLIGEYIQEGNDTDKIGSYLEWLTKRDEVYAYDFKGDWIDVGDIDSYTEAICSF